jgi:hypothetical protein
MSTIKIVNNRVLSIWAMDVEKTIAFLLESQAPLQAMFEAEKDRIKEEAGRTKEEAGPVKEEMAGICQILQETTLIQREQARILVESNRKPSGTKRRSPISAELSRIWPAPSKSPRLNCRRQRQRSKTVTIA